MLSSITPLGEQGRASRWPVTATAYLLGSMLGGAGVGALGGGIGWLLPFEVAAFTTAALVLLAAATAVAVLVECRLLPSLPTVRRQVDEDWLHRYRGWVYGFGFGVQLGAGLMTIVTSPTVYVTLVLAAVTGSPPAGAVIGLVFGLTRALPVVGQRGVRTTARLARSSQRLASLAPTGRAVAATGLGAASVASAAQALSMAGS